MGEFQSGQMGQTVNLLACVFGGSNPPSPTRAGVAQLARALAFQAKGRGFESRFPLQFFFALIAQLVERILGKDEVTSSNLVKGSSFPFELKK